MPKNKSEQKGGGQNLSSGLTTHAETPETYEPKNMFEHYDNWWKNASLWERLKWKLFMKRVEISLMFSHMRKKRLFKSRCIKGWHNFSKCYWSATNSKGQKLSVHYLKCSNCDIVYFTTKRQKQIYTRLKERRFDIISRALKESGREAPKKKKMKIKTL